MSKIERRFIAELRVGGVDGQGDEMSLVGYAAKFNTQSQDLGGFRETVMPGAFARSLREGADVKFLMNHDPSLVMGRTKSGTLNLQEDATGLKFNVRLPDTQAARDLHTLVKRGDIDQCSFAFTVNGEDWSDEKNEAGDMYASRKLMDVNLMDVSAVTYPAYTDTNVSARFDDQALVEIRSKIKDLEDKRSSDTATDAKDPKAEAAEKAASADEHNDAADYHSKEASKAKKAGEANKVIGPLAAAAAHKEAAKAHEDAFKSAAKAGGKDASDADKTNASAAMGYASEATKSASNASWGANHRSMSKRGSENTPPASTSQVDLQWPLVENNREDWWNAFNDCYQDLMKKGGVGFEIKEALGLAVAAANKQVQPQTEVTPAVSGQGKNPTKTGKFAANTDTDGDDDADDYERHIRLGEFRYTDGSYEALVSDINWALCQKYGYNYWVMETYPDKIIVQNSADGCFYQLNYEMDDDGCVMFTGDQIKVEQQFVPTERMKVAAEARIYKSKADVPDYVPSDKKAQWKEVWNSAYKSAKKDGKSDDDAEKSAFAQANGVAGPKSRNVSDPDSADYDPDDPDYDPDWEANSKKIKDPDPKLDQTNDAKKTKKVAGKDLTSDKFAWVGDPSDPSTWKLPVHDEGHARNALARFNQTKGIPADKKDGVWKKIVAACKKFGIAVSDEDSIRCGMDCTIAQGIMTEPVLLEELQVAAMRAKHRLIEIDLN